MIRKVQAEQEDEAHYTYPLNPTNESTHPCLQGNTKLMQYKFSTMK